MTQIDLIQTADTIGFIGVFSILIAYFLLQINRLSSTGLGYSLINLLGASMILVSLAYHWNLPAVVMEGAWALISFYGIVKALCFSSSVK